MKHLPINANMKMADVIHLDYLLLPIIGRFGIDLGFGNKTVKEICSEKDINIAFFLEIMNSYHNQDYFIEDQFQNYPLTLIVDYLKNTHAYYVNTKIPELELMVQQFIDSSSEENKINNKLIADFFEEYKLELIRHLRHEESTVFPYTHTLEKVLRSSIPPELLKKIKEKPFRDDDDDHGKLEEKLFDLKNLIIKFLPPVKRKDIMEKLLIELYRLEDDLNDHSRIEDKVLIPKVIQLEQKILELGASL